MKKVVVMGGGTGTYRVLSGLKHYPVDLTAVVAMSDSGGSTGRLRDELGILPPGDLRNCLVALSRNPEIEWLFRFRYGSRKSINEVGGHNLGNLIFTAFVEQYGDFMKGLAATHRFLNIHERNRVLPVTLANTQLKAMYHDGTEVIGETHIDRPEIERALPIDQVMLLPEAYICKESADAILHADFILFGPGDLYTSIIPTLLPHGVREALRETKAKKVYLCNVMTKFGETSGKNSVGEVIFKASDFLREIERYAGVSMDFIICNSKPPTIEIAERYLKEYAYFVEPDIHDQRVIVEDVVSEGEFYRHDPVKLAQIIIQILHKDLVAPRIT